jgi:2'-hydroxyisoflavone reductase
MKILILGGTVFLGRHTVEAALARGHEPTLFNRGQHNADLFPDVEKIRDDRDPQKGGGLELLKGQKWDAVIDFCGYVPRVVAASAQALAASVDHYTFISSVSVYPDLDSVSGQNENSPVGKLTDETIEEITGESYGPLKALCEQAAESALPGRTLTIRPGLIVGPNDPTDRFTYWPIRVAKGGDVLCPGNPNWETQVIDVRDLAEWTVRLVEDKVTGVFNATGPNRKLTFGEIIETSKTVSDSDAHFVWADEQWLLDQKVEPWLGLPLWLGPEGDMTVKIERAVSAGLTFRPLADTVRDTLNWDATRPKDHEWRAGLRSERETELVDAWLTR